jgi:hypothetical protein
MEKTNNLLSELLKLIQHCNAQKYVGENWGFLLGIGYTVTFRRILNAPLSTLFVGAIAAPVCSWGGSIVQEVLPQDLRFLIPVSCFACIVYTQIKDLFSKKPVQGFNFSIKIN